MDKLGIQIFLKGGNWIVSGDSISSIIRLGQPS